MAQTISMADGFTLTINDPNGILGSNQAALINDLNYVIKTLNSYIVFKAPLDLQVNVEPASANSGNTDGLSPAGTQWVYQNNAWALVGEVKAQTGVDLNGSAPDSGFTIYAGNDGTLKNYGSPVWFDPNPQLGVTPSIPNGEADYVSIMTHELMHTIGFAASSSATSAWNQHTYQSNGVWYYTSPAIVALLDGPLPLAPNETDNSYPADHIGNTSLTYQPVTSDMMYEWGNYANNRWDFGQVDLTILRDLGYTIQNYQSLPLVDPIDTADVTGTAGNDVLQAPRVSAIITGGDGDDRIVLPAAAGNGNYLIIGGAGANSVVVGQAYAGFDLVKYNSDYLLQQKAGLDGVSLLREIQTVVFTDATATIDATDSSRTIVATAPGVVQDYAGAVADYTLSVAASSIVVRDAQGADTLVGVEGIQFSDHMLIVAAPPGTSSVTTGNVAELYAAVLDREPDVAGLAFYQTYLTANPGTPFLQFAEWFLSSPEYTARHTYAPTTAGDAQFITDSYENLLHRTPSAAEVGYYQANVMAPALANLAPGSQAYSAAEFQAHAQMLVYFSASPEFLADVQVTAQHPADAQHWLVLT